MATNIRSISIGVILIQNGNGVPTHISSKGTLFVNLDTAILYINKDGIATWETNNSGGFTLTQNQFNAITGATSPSSTNVFATISDIVSSAFTGGTVNGLTTFTAGLSATTISACTSVQTNKLISCSGDTQISLSSGQTIFNTNLTPNLDATIDVGTSSKRFRDINTVSGTSTVWTSTIKVTTPTLDLGNDSLGNLRQITANNSIIQDDALLGGTY
jgi:hypothetical protein